MRSIGWTCSELLDCFDGRVDALESTIADQLYMLTTPLLTILQFTVPFPLILCSTLVTSCY